MFVHYFTHVPVPMSEVEHRLDRIRDNLSGWADVAYREGEELRAKVGPAIGGVAKEIRLEIGIPEIHRSGLVYPVKWTALGAGVLFPSLKATLTLSHVGRDNTKVTFEGTYEPPLGPVGRVVDRIVLGRFADATVQNWVDRLAGALNEATVS